MVGDWVGGWVCLGSSVGACQRYAVLPLLRQVPASARMLSLLVCAGISQQHRQTTPFCLLVLRLFVVCVDEAVARSASSTLLVAS
jgi:hypothetical protein